MYRHILSHQRGGTSLCFAFSPQYKSFIAHLLKPSSASDTNFVAHPRRPTCHQHTHFEQNLLPKIININKVEKVQNVRKRKCFSFRVAHFVKRFLRTLSALRFRDQTTISLPFSCSSRAPSQSPLREHLIIISMILSATTNDSARVVIKTRLCKNSGHGDQTWGRNSLSTFGTQIFAQNFICTASSPLMPFSKNSDLQIRKLFRVVLNNKGDIVKSSAGVILSKTSTAISPQMLLSIQAISSLELISFIFISAPSFSSNRSVASTRLLIYQVGTERGLIKVWVVSKHFFEEHSGSLPPGHLINQVVGKVLN
ncbi:uncharacterized protein BDR25DRAFT_356176 [Lindgomyces ingoldianus]|uniref:Uncharacterized protein n=1 Tax=Lindgomyces ingoldianus TaxID=673940 RepID=A0ACB6QSM4_9PLEO|nr:uncharacterized protein BDR25DRAFT_356176 [Lindgomyces ingoldianus]KAF2469901.1 hypothetical protein BDR25DRAFT_356176 [Lindgomyces ingoldianus]